MIGAFYQPQAVLADLTALQTLPQRELSAGMAEVIKYGALGDAEFFCLVGRKYGRPDGATPRKKWQKPFTIAAK